MKLGNALSQALARSRQEQQTWVVASLESDDMESWVIKAMPLTDTYCDEFVAWDGRILVVVEPDGRTD